MPLPWGRPPPGLTRRERDRWEHYQAQQSLFYTDGGNDALRFQDLGSDDDLHDQDVLRYRHGNRSVSDELFFNDGSSRYPRQMYEHEHNAYGDAYDSTEWGSEGSGEDAVGSAAIHNSSDAEQLLAQKALEKIDRAKSKGKNTVSLTHEEISALERYRRPLGDSSERMSRDSTDKARTRNGSEGAWTRRRGSSRPSLTSSTTSGLAPAKQRTKNRSRKRPSPTEESHPQMPPGLMTMGPGGVPLYTPMGYAYPTARRVASEGQHYSAAPSTNSSRSASGSSRRPYDVPPYPSSRDPRGYPDMDPYAYAQYQTYPPPGSEGRRVASGPSQVTYSSVYRRPIPTSAGATRGRPNGSEASLGYSERRPSGLGQKYESGGTSTDEESEIEVEFEEESDDELGTDPSYVERSASSSRASGPAKNTRSGARKRK